MRNLEKTLRIERLSHDGRGIARSDGKVGFVAGALPGETVRARRTRASARHDEWSVVSIETAAPVRTEPPCPLYGRCGGCDLQHLAPPAQLEHKRDALLELLARQAGLAPRVLDPTIESAPLGYRRRARLAVDARARGKPPRLGFRESAGSAIVPVDACPVLDPVLERLPATLAPLLGALANPRAIGHVDLAVSESRDGSVRAVVAFRLLGTLDAADHELLADYGTAERAYVATVHDDGTVRTVHAPVCEPPGYLLADFDLRLAFEPGDFLQANAGVNRAVVARVVDWLNSATDALILDAFCGLGNLSLPLARAFADTHETGARVPGARVLGVDVSAGMIVRARRNMEANGVRGAEFAVRDLYASELSLPKRGSDARGFDVVVLDPPRAGAAELVQLICALRVPRVLYQSCAPATLARDGRVLREAGYRLERLCLVDMFPQTSHSEALALFCR